MKDKKTVKRIKEEIVRGVAVQIFLFSAAAAVTGWYSIAFVLAADFFIRACIGSRFSPAVFLSKTLVAPLFRFRKRMIVEKPKKFAAGIGFFLALSAGAAGFAGLVFWTRVFTGLLALFSFLEAFMGFCAGCRIFGFMIRLGIIKEEVCEDCSVDSGE